MRRVSNFIAGFLTGLVVSVFSKTLVLLTGVAIVAIQVSQPPNIITFPSQGAFLTSSQMASRWGVDLLGMLRLRQRIEASRVLSSLNRNPTFKLAFGSTFALAAFMQF